MGKRILGFTLVEAITALAILALVFAGLISGFVANSRAYGATREEVASMNALRQIAETIRGCPTGQAASLYQGFKFTVPETGGTGSVKVFVNEMDTSPEASILGLPRDIDGDGLVSNTDVTANYILLPVRISTTWTGSDGTHTKELYLLCYKDGG